MAEADDIRQMHIDLWVMARDGHEAARRRGPSAAETASRYTTMMRMYEGMLGLDASPFSIYVV